jgi:uncharacterized protein
MARLSYSAPGVYVEEVPSAQQPIAGVGTNTVGFIGVVPDTIYYPVPNPNYDPVLAEAAWKLQQMPATDENIFTLVKGVNQLESIASKLTDQIKRIEDKSESARTPRDVAELAAKKQELKRRQQARQVLVGIIKEKGEGIEKSLREKISALQSSIPPERPSRARPSPEPDAGAPDAAPPQPAPPSADLAEKRRSLSLWQQRSQELDKIRRESIEAATMDENELLKASDLKPFILNKFPDNGAQMPEPLATKLCTNFTEYMDRFGGFSVDCSRLTPKTKELQALETSTHRALTHAVYGFFKNGGTRCFVARVRDAVDIPKALEAFESIDQIAIVAAPGLARSEVWDALVSHCERCEDRFAILDSPEVVAKTGEKPQEGKEPELDITLLNYDSMDYQDFLPPRNKNAAFYFPWIQVMDPAKQLQDQDPVLGRNLWTRGRFYVPPSGHIAGIYARTDEERGVHKAPANVAVLGALDVKYYISKAKQELLNPQGVNCIRNLNGNITVWGARTVGGDSNYEWKYISVRRFFLFLRESIDEGTQWVVFEPNDQNLWGKIRLNITAFLRNVWRSGALFGETPEEAFYVKCDAELNPPDVRDLGMVVTEIGVAIVRPAEFVIFRITQSTGLRTAA